MDCNLPGSSAYGIPQARILEWVAISFPRASSQPRDQTCLSPLQPCYQHHSPNGTFFFFFYQGKMFIVTITQSQWFTLCFIPGCGHSLYNRYNSLQFLTEYFHFPPKSFVLSYPATDNHQSFYCLHSFAFSRMSYSWDHTVSNISRLPDFTCCCYCC